MPMHANDMHDFADDFDRVVFSDGQLLGSACIYCQRFIAFYEDAEQLSQAERAHTCPEMMRTA